MTDDLRLAERLSTSLGDGPPLPPLETHLRAGHRALARRRRHAVAGATAVVLLGLAVAATGGRPDNADTATETPPATSGSSPTPPPSTVPMPRDDVELTADGALTTAPGVEVLQRVPNPLGLRPPNHSLGIAYTRDGGEETWALLDYTVDDDGVSSGSVVSDPARKSLATLRRWIDSVRPTTEPPEAPVEFVDAESEELRPSDGAVIVAQTGEVEIAGFAEPEDRVAAAMVRFEGGGSRSFVLARQIGDASPEYLVVDGSVGGPDLDAFLAYADRHYAEGEGLR